MTLSTGHKTRGFAAVINACAAWEGVEFSSKASCNGRCTRVLSKGRDAGLARA